MTQDKEQDMKFVQLPNKAVVNVDNIAFILNPELNVYIIIPKQSISPSVPKLDGNEFDALLKYLDAETLKVERPAEVEKRLIARVDEDKQTTKVS